MSYGKRKNCRQETDRDNQVEKEKHGEIERERHHETP